MIGMNRRRFLQAALAGAAGVPLARLLEGVSKASGPPSLQNFI